LGTTASRARSTDGSGHATGPVPTCPTGVGSLCASTPHSLSRDPRSATSRPCRCHHLRDGN